MAIPTNRIFLRSPYFVSHEAAGLEKIAIDLYIYTGTLTTDKPSDPQFELESTAYLNEAGTANYAEIDIAELARDYVEVTYNGSDDSNAVWIEYDLSTVIGGVAASVGTTKLTGLDGFGYFEDGYNPDPQTHLLMSGNYIVAPKGQSVTIPVLQDYLTGYKTYDEVYIGWTTLVHTVTGLTTSEETDDVVQYITSTTGAGADDIITKVEFQFSNTTDKAVHIRYIEECKYEPVEMKFVNRYGALQTLWWFQKSALTLNTQEEMYKRNLLDEGTYSIYRHQNNTLEKNGTLTMRISSGWYPEESNAVFAEALLSEAVWVDVPSAWLDNNAHLTADTVTPVNIKNSSIAFKTRLNDKLIEYTFDVEFAADRINNIR